jgi:hypothetical protein
MYIPSYLPLCSPTYLCFLHRQILKSLPTHFSHPPSPLILPINLLMFILVMDVEHRFTYVGITNNL